MVMIVITCRFHASLPVLTYLSGIRQATGGHEGVHVIKVLTITISLHIVADINQYSVLTHIFQIFYVHNEVFGLSS